MIDLEELAERMVRTVRNGGTNEEIKQEFMRSAKLLMEKPKRESRAMLPCKCGCKRREHWLSADREKPEGLKCMKCGFNVWGANQTDVIRQWNKAVQEVSGDG